MKKALGLIALVLAVGLTAAHDAQAKRLGGAKSAGMQRQNVTAPATPPAGARDASPTQAAPAAGATAAAAAPGAAAAATKRSWMGPVAGLAAGLGIAALASHFGFGEALANFLTIALLAMGVMLLVGFLLRKRGQAQGLAGAGAGAYGAAPVPVPPTNTLRQAAGGGSLIGSRLGGGLGSPAPAAGFGQIPAGFDVAGFERNAREQFLALQAANDAGDLQRLGDYLTPEMLEIVREEVASRGGLQQQTQVFGLQAQLLDVAQEPAQYIASVRFTGSIREQHGEAPEDLDEIWHLAKPLAGSGGWVVAGIQQHGG